MLGDNVGLTEGTIVGDGEGSGVGAFSTYEGEKEGCTVGIHEGVDDGGGVVRDGALL